MRAKRSSIWTALYTFTAAYSVKADVTDLPARRIAIIGAGAAGSSAAYWVHNFSYQAGLPVELTLFERNDYIGGRSTTVNVFDNPTEPVELGASIFVPVNHVLVDAVNDLGLETLEGLGNNRRSIHSGKVDSLWQERISAFLRNIISGVWKSRNERSIPSNEYEADRIMAIYDGIDVVYAQEAGSTWFFDRWWKTAKLLYQYGVWDPVNSLRLVGKTINTFLELYDDPNFPFNNLTLAAQGLSQDLLLFTGNSTDETLESNGISTEYGYFAHDIVQAASRVNYASNLDDLHGLEGMVSMAGDGAMAVQGGNWQIFAGMLERSGAKVRLNHSVVGITRNVQSETYIVSSVESLTASGVIEEDQHLEHAPFDEVIVAAPFHQTNVKIDSAITYHIPADDEYRTLYVTLFTSPAPLKKSRFAVQKSFTRKPFGRFRKWVRELRSSGVKYHHTDDEDTATTVLTTRSIAGPEPEFFSISTLRWVWSPFDPYRAHRLYKIFSPEPISNEWIASELLDPIECIGSSASLDFDPLKDQRVLNSDQNRRGREHCDPISWIYRKTWQPYPILKCRTWFEPLRLDLNVTTSKTNQGPGGLWYTSGMDEFISTMETNALMGKNVARLMVNEWVSDLDPAL